MKIGRSDIIKIATSKYKLLGEQPIKKIDYNKWVKFIEAHKDYFVWYEDTPDGIDAKQNIDKVPDWAREGTLKRLNKLCAYSTNKVEKKTYDFIVDYGINDGMVRINIERKMTRLIAEILLEMAKFLDGKIIINGTEILENTDQLE